LTLNLQDESRSGSPPDTSINAPNLAKDALRIHIAKWYGGEAALEQLEASENMSFYTREELALLGINLLEKE
jgi:hypothetical protein